MSLPAGSIPEKEASGNVLQIGINYTEMIEENQKTIRLKQKAKENQCYKDT